MVCPTCGQPAVPILPPLTTKPSDRHDNNGAKETFNGTIRVIRFDYLVGASAYYPKMWYHLICGTCISHITHTRDYFIGHAHRREHHKTAASTHHPYLNRISFDTRESDVWWSQTCAGFRTSGIDSDFVSAPDGVNFLINILPGESILNLIQGRLKGLIPISILLWSAPLERGYS